MIHVRDISMEKIKKHQMYQSSHPIQSAGQFEHLNLHHHQFLALLTNYHQTQLVSWVHISYTPSFCCDRATNLVLPQEIYCTIWAEFMSGKFSVARQRRSSNDSFVSEVLLFVLITFNCENTRSS